MKTPLLTDSQKSVLEAMHVKSEPISLKGKALRAARGLAARGFVKIEADTVTMLEAGRSALLVDRDRRAAREEARTAVDPDRPETWGPPPKARRKRQKLAPLEQVYRQGLVNDEERTMALHFVRGYTMITSGAHYRSTLWSERVDEGGAMWSETVQDFERRIQDRYSLFREHVAAAGLPLEAIIDVLVFDVSFRTIDRRYRRPDGWFVKELLALLSSCVKAAGRKNIHETDKN